MEVLGRELLACVLEVVRDHELDGKGAQRSRERAGILVVDHQHPGIHAPIIRATRRTGYARCEVWLRAATLDHDRAAPIADRDLAIVHHTRQRTIAGAPEQVRDRLLALGQEYGVDEFVIVTMTHDFKARVRSYELMAEAFTLSPR